MPRQATDAEAAALKAQAMKDAETIAAAFGEDGGEIAKNIGPDGAVFGSVTAAEVVALIKERAVRSIAYQMPAAVRHARAYIILYSRLFAVRRTSRSRRSRSRCPRSRQAARAQTRHTHIVETSQRTASCHSPIPHSHAFDSRASTWRADPGLRSRRGGASQGGDQQG